jgi:hypothetical protein
MNFRKVNNITGWVICVIASLVYILTSEKSGSFWDTGEFVAAAYKVQMPHPPGAPLFVLIGRFFIILFGDSGATAAKAINIMNALASGFTVLFLFWSITHFARKLTSGFLAEPDKGQLISIMGAGIVGALAFTFSDSFWYSAVEGEVYAFSSFFTALAFWAMLKWERADIAAGNDANLKARADRWIVFIFFSMGLSIGVHLLGILTIPAIVMIYYFRRYNYTRWGAIWAFVISCLIVGLVQVVVVQLSVKLAGRFDIFFVNSFGLPFFSGFIFFFLLLGGLAWWGLKYAGKKNLPLMRLGLWSFVFMMLGYSSYITPLERSNANTAVDMNNVDNPMSLVYYLGRDQYGSQPIMTGPHFLAQYTGGEPKTVYGKGKDENGKDAYISYDAGADLEYDSRDIQLFPRTWDGNDPNHANFYVQWLDLPISGITVRADCNINQTSRDAVEVIEASGQRYVYSVPEGFAVYQHRMKGQYKAGEQIALVQIPTMANNLEWFFTYQMSFMYWRYFMWNFAGKQNDLQGMGNVRDGNWMTGISFLDDMRLGDQKMMPDSLKKNKANNNLFLLPFILGILGCVYQFFKDRRDWIAAFLLFFFTGVAIVIYLNQPGGQPRERDYAFAGSYYAFAIWIGLSVVAFARMAKEIADKVTLMNTLIYGGLITFLILLLSDVNHMNGSVFAADLMGGILFSIITLAITLIVRAVSKTNLKSAALVTTAVCALVPVLMASVEWNDHDRSQKLLAPDQAKNYLMACPKDAILFTYGDNDTYPLWYAQEVEGVRPDLRIINTSLLGIDWYVNQLRYKVNESAPINVILSEDQVRGLGYVRVNPRNIKDGQDLLSLMTEISKQGPKLTNFPYIKTVKVPVDSALAVKNGIVNPGEAVLPELIFDLSAKGGYTLDEITMLNIIAANAWKRPICFTGQESDLGFGQYLRNEGLIHQLTPIADQMIARGTMPTDSSSVNMLLNGFRSGNAQNGNVYFDEENRRHLLSLRRTYAIQALSLVDANRKDEAKKILDKAEGLINTEALPYAMTSSVHNQNYHNYIGTVYLRAAYSSGHNDLAKKVKDALVKDLNDQLNYYKYLREQKPNSYNQLINDERDATRMLGEVTEMEKSSLPKPPVRPELQLKDSGDTQKKP